MRLIAAVVLLLLCIQVVSAQEPSSISSQLAQTPPMGWNSWNKFGCNVSEQMIREMADAMVSSGMKDAGYQYIVIDDCWQVERDRQGNIVADKKTFPSGMKALADYVHSKGLKFGLYSDAGSKTCAGRPGSRGHEFQDALQYAAWGVDYLKYDWCNTSTQNAEASYKLMREALDASGRPILFSMCEWGTAKPWLWAKNVGHMWRTTGDIQDRWEGTKDGMHGMMTIVDMQADLYPYSGPGHWNDPDMLEVGNGGMTANEYRAHFSLWAMLAAPLIAGNDLRSMSADTKSILMNKEVIAVDQDPLGQQARRVRKDGDLEVWARPLMGGNRAVLLLNRGNAPAEIMVRWEDLNYPPSLTAAVRDLWQAKDLPRATGKLSANVEPHSVVMVTLKP